MRKFFCFTLLALLAFGWGRAATASPQQQQYGRTLAFEENKGQVLDVSGQRRPDVLYTARVGGAKLYFQKDGVSYVFKKTSADGAGVELYRMDLRLDGANPNATVTAGSPAAEAGVNNYYARGAAVLGVRSFERLTYREVYPNIDLVFYTTEQFGVEAIKYDFVVRPGGDPSQIRMKWVAGQPKINADGSLETVNPFGKVTEMAPVSYTTTKAGYESGDMAMVNVAANQLVSAYEFNGETVGFRVGNYDQNKTLVIDPVTLVWGTYYGGDQQEVSVDLTVDANNNVFITGYTQSDNFPVTPGAVQGTRNQNEDAFVVKFDENGVRQWSTYLGGIEDDAGQSVSVDDDNIGKIAVTGRAGADFPISCGDDYAVSQSPNEPNVRDLFIAYFDQDGTLDWARYYGGGNGGDLAVYGADEGLGIDFVSNGDMVVVGATHAVDFPQVTTGGVTNNPYVGAYDIILMRVTNQCDVTWATTYGGSNNDIANDVVVDDNDNFVVVGSTEGAGFSVVNAFQTGCSNCGQSTPDAFAMKFDVAGALSWATFYGGTAEDRAFGAAVSGDGETIYVAGLTRSSDSPPGRMATPSAYQNNNQGSYDGFLLKMNGTGQRLWSTYVGGTALDRANDVAIDGNGDAILFGSTASSVFTPANTFPYAGTLNGPSDAFFAKFRSEGQLRYGSYYGGNGAELASAIEVDAAGNWYVTGQTNGAGLPTRGEGTTFEENYAGRGDGYVAKFRCDEVPVNVLTDLSNICEGSIIRLDAEAPGFPNAEIIWTGPNVEENPSGSGVFVFDATDGVQPGDYDINYFVRDACTDTVSVTATVVEAPAIQVNGLPAGPVCADAPCFTLTATPAGGTWSGPSVVNTGNGQGDYCPATGPEGEVTLIYEVTVNECLLTQEVTIIVNPLPDVSISFPNGDEPPYCSNRQTPLRLTGSPAGGEWSPVGPFLTTGGFFTPSEVTNSPANVEYTYTDQFGCSNTAARSIEVTPFQDLEILGLGAGQFCRDDQTRYELTGSPISGGTFSGPGIESDQQNRWFFVPANVPGSPSTVDIVYEVSDGGCDYRVTERVQLTTRPDARIFGLNSQRRYCLDQLNPVNLSGTPSGGTFSASAPHQGAVVGTQFFPNNITPDPDGSTEVVINYVGDFNGCAFDASETVTVTTPPQVVITGLEEGTFCSNDCDPRPLVGTPAGGTFRGPGVVGASFRPCNAGVGDNIVIIYSGNFNGCDYADTVTVTVEAPQPTQVTVGPEGPYCITSNDPVSLNANVPVTFSSSCVDILNNREFFPSSATRSGSCTITATPEDGVCALPTTVSVVINNQPAATINFSRPGPYCITDNQPVTLTGFPSGGTFTVNGQDVGNSFVPSALGVGTFPVEYFGFLNGCEFSQTAQVTISPEPFVELRIVNAPDEFCVSDATEYDIIVSPANAQVSGRGVRNVGNAQNPNYVFVPRNAGEGTHTIEASGNEAGCDYATSIDVVVRPQVQTTVTFPNGNTGPFCITDGNPVCLESTPPGATFNSNCLTFNGNCFAPNSATQAGICRVDVQPSEFECALPTTVNIQISSEPNATITFSQPGPYCEDRTQPVTLIGSPTGGDFTINGPPVLSGNTFVPADYAPGQHEVRYTGDVGGCTYEAVATFTVTERPEATISGIDPIEVRPYCVTDCGPYALTGFPAGGTFSGPGVSGAQFRPCNAGAGTHTITYSGTFEGCQYSTTIRVSVENQTQTTLALSPEGPFCVNDFSTYTVEVQPDNNPQDFTFSGAGNGGSFSPANLGVGNYTIRVEPASDEVCYTGASISFVVSAEPTPSINLSSEGPYCETAQAVTLTGSPAGGAFSGQGITGNRFNPGAVNCGSFTTITYSGSVNGCDFQTTVDLEVTCAPDPAITGFEGRDFCAIISQDVTLFGQPNFDVTNASWTGAIQNQGDPTTANFNPVNAGAGAQTVIYSGTFRGCQFTTSEVLNVDAAQETNINFSRTGPYCEDDTQPVTVTTNTNAEILVDGQFIGVGNATFIPADYATGTRTITAEPVDGECANPGSATFVITGQVTANLNMQVPGPYCEDQTTPVTVQFTPSGGNLTATCGACLVEENGIFRFVPSVAGPGTHTITYSGNEGPCQFSESIQVQVNAQPEVLVTPVPAGPFCETDCQQVFLDATPPGGTFQGAGVNGNTFVPCNAGAGEHVIVYSGAFEGCQYSTEGDFSITVTAEPDPVVTGLEQGSYCITDFTQFPLTGTPNGGTFEGPGVIAQGQGFAFVPANAGVGTHQICYRGNLGGCDYEECVTVVVTAEPTPQIVGDIQNGPFCITRQNPITLIGDPTGGEFSGPGVQGNQFVPANVGNGPGTYDITYSGNFNGCDYETTFTVTISGVPTVTASVTPEGPFCSNDCNPKTLTGDPFGGTFSGPGVSGTSFVPCNAGPAIHTITYSGQLEGCDYSETFSIEVTAPVDPQILFSDDAPYCTNQNENIQLTGNPAGGTFYAIGPNGRVNLPNGLFNPATVSNGQPTVLTIGYEGRQGGCDFSTETTVQVNTPPDVVISGAATTDGPFCATDGNSYLLVGQPSGGAFSGPGVNGSLFVPAQAGPGNHTITYSGELDGCAYSANITVTVTPEPNPQIAGLTIEPYCPGDEDSYDLFGTPLGGTFSGPGVTGNSFSPQDAGPGTHTICYRGETGGCVYEICTEVTVREPIEAEIRGLAPSYCISDCNMYQLEGFPAGGLLGGPGTQGLSIIPCQMLPRPGVATIFYYGVFEGCEYYVEATTIIEGAEPSRIEGLDEQYCESDPAVPVTTAPQGGILSGPGIINNGGAFTFDPGTAGPGFHRIESNFPDEVLCIEDNVTFVLVQEAPDLTLASPSFGVINASATGGAGVYTYSLDGGAFSPEATFTGLEGGRTYEVCVRDFNGCEDCETITVDAGVDCECPTNIAASDIGIVDATVSWTPAAAAQSYQVRIRLDIPGEQFSAPISVTGNSFTFEGLEPSAPYEVSVTSICANNQTSESCSVQFTTFDCKAPDFFEAVNVSSSTVDLEWDEIQGSDGYEVQYQLVGADPTNWTPVPARRLNGSGSTTTTFTGLIPNRDYTARIRTICSEADDLYSPRIFAFFTTLDGQEPECNCPANISASDIGIQDATISWTPNGAAQSYQITLRLDIPGSQPQTFTTTNTTFTFDNLEPSAPYVATVASVCTNGETSEACPVSFTTFDCKVPDFFEAEIVDGTGVTFNWDEVPGSDGYLVQYQLLGAGPDDWTPVPARRIDGATNTSTTFLGLLPNRDYTARIRTICNEADDLFSPYEFEFFSTGGDEPLECECPTNIQESGIGIQDATVSWTPNGAALSYRVDIRLDIPGSQTQTFTTTNTTFTFDNLEPSAPYVVTVASNCANGEVSEGCTVSFTTFDCKVPDFFEAEVVNGTGVTFNWDEVPGSDGYLVQYQLLGAGPDDWTPTPARRINGSANTSTTFAGLLPNRDYTARIRTICVEADDLLSPYEFEFFTTTEPTGDCAPVPNLSVINVDETSGLVQWNAVENAQSYEVQVRVAGGAFGQTQSALATQFTLSNLTCGTNYEVRVRAVCDANTFSDWSSFAFTTDDCAGGDCEAPQTIIASNVTPTSAVITWSAVNTATLYELQYKTAAETQYQSEIVSGTSFTITGLDCPEDYDVRVRALCPNGESAFATTSFSIENCDPTSCFAPQNVEVEILTESQEDNTVQITWNTIDDAIFYEVQHKLRADSDWGPIFFVNAPDTSYNVSNITCPNVYDARVRVICADGTSNYAQASFTLDDCGTTGDCPAPQNLRQIGDQQLTEATVAWDAVPQAIAYRLSYKAFNEQSYIDLGQVSGTSQNITGLMPSMLYDFRVQTVCQNGVSAPADGQFATIDCQAPFDVRVVRTTPSRVELSWDWIEEAVGYEIEYKRLQADDSEYEGTAIFVANPPSPPTEGVTHTVEELDPSLEYLFRVKSICQETPERVVSPWTYEPTNTENCETVTNVQITGAQCNSFTVSWGTVESATGYIVRWRNIDDPEAIWEVIEINDPFQSFVVVEGLNSGTNYTVQVITVCEDGSATAPAVGEITTSPSEICCAPATEGEVSNITRTGATVSWTASVAPNTLGYFVQFRDASSPDNQWQPPFPGLNAGTETSFTFTEGSLQPCTPYQARIRTSCGDGDGFADAIVLDFTTECDAGDCNCPGGIAASNVTEAGALLTWNAAQGAQGYEVRYRVSGGQFTNPLAFVETQAQLSGLEAATEYEAQVRTICPLGQVSEWCSVTFTTAGGECLAPNSVTATATSAFTIDVMWNAVGGAESYNVFYRNTTTGVEESVSVDTPATMVTLTNLDPSTTYEIQVQTVCIGGETSPRGPQPPLEEETPDAGPCGPVEGLTVGEITLTGGEFTWEVNANATAYEVQFRASGDADWSAPITVTEPAFSTNVLQPCTDYQIRVRAVCGDGNNFSTYSTRRFSTDCNQPCAAPQPFVEAPTVTCSTATIIWGDVETASEYEIQYREAGGVWSIVENASMPPFNIEGLMASAEYEVRIRTICSGGDQSEFATTTFFTPSCIPGEGTTWHIVTGGDAWEEGLDVARTEDGGYVVTGYTLSWGAGDYDVYLAKFNAFGGKVWDKTYGSDARDEGRSVIVTDDGGFLIAGFTTGFNVGEASAYLIKTDAQGNVEWERTYGDANWNIAYDVEAANDGGYIIAGTALSETEGRDVYLAKIGADGALQWQNTYSGSEDEYGYSVAPTSDGGYAVAGYTRSFGAGRQDGLALKVTGTGTLQWANAYGEADRDFFFDIAEDADGNLVAAGYSRSFGDVDAELNNGDVYVVRMNDAGQELWSRVYGNTAFDFANGITVASDGNYVLTGGNSENNTNVTILKVETDGEVVFSSSFGEQLSEEGNKVYETLDGGYIIAGQSNSFELGNERNANVYLIKTDENGKTDGCNEFTYDVTEGAPITLVANAPMVQTAITNAVAPPSAVVTDPGFNVEFVCAASVCSEILNLTVSNIEATRATVSWTAIGVAGSFELQYRDTSDANWSLPISVTGNEYTINGLVAGTTYDVRVRAICAIDSSVSLWAEDQFTTAPSEAECVVPENLRATNVGFDEIEVAFTLVPAAQSYQVSFREEGEDTWITEDIFATEVPYTIAGLDTGTTYQIRVQAVCNPINQSGWSDTISVVTLDQRAGGVESAVAMNVKLYPNPTRGEVNVSFTTDSDAPATVRVFDVTGRAVSAQSFDAYAGSNELMIDLSDVATGVYVVQLEQDGRKEVTKVIVE